MTDPKVKRWLGRWELAKVRAGLVNGMEAVDAAAASEGQAESMMRSWSKRVRVWELEES